MSQFLFEEVPVRERTGLRPVSVLAGTDGEAIGVLLAIHCCVAKPRILDCTHNRGVMWRDTRYSPIRMDLSAEFPLDIAADFRRMPFADCSFDVIVFDPPHLPEDVGKGLKYSRRFKAEERGRGMIGGNISGAFAPFLAEAKRTLKADGVILAKIADLVHNHRQQWQQVDFVNAVRSAGMTACDMLIKTEGRAARLRSPRWEKVYHLRKAHTYWIVVRKSKGCECPAGK